MTEWNNDEISKLIDFIEKRSLTYVIRHFSGARNCDELASKFFVQVSGNSFCYVCRRRLKSSPRSAKKRSIQSSQVDYNQHLRFTLRSTTVINSFFTVENILALNTLAARTNFSQVPHMSGTFDEVTCCAGVQLSYMYRTTSILVSGT